MYGLYYDEFATMEGFKRISTVVTCLKDSEVKELESELRKRQHWKIYGVLQFNYIEMFSVLITNSIARAICEKQRYSSWEELISRFLWKAENSFIWPME